jgi:hypothetical protein
MTITGADAVAQAQRNDTRAAASVIASPAARLRPSWTRRSSESGACVWPATSCGAPLPKRSSGTCTRSAPSGPPLGPPWTSPARPTIASLPTVLTVK